MSAIGTKRTWPSALHMSAIGVKADMTIALKMSAFDPRRGLDHFEHICSTIALISCIFCSHIFSVHFGLVGVKPVFEIPLRLPLGPPEPWRRHAFDADFVYVASASKARSASASFSCASLSGGNKLCRAAAHFFCWQSLSAAICIDAP